MSKKLVSFLILTAIFFSLPFGLLESSGSRKSARDAVRKADIRQIMTAAEMCYGEHDEYPSSLSIPQFLKYMPVPPKDPVSGKIYEYTTSADRQKFTVTAILENGSKYVGTERGFFELTLPPQFPTSKEIFIQVLTYITLIGAGLLMLVIMIFSWLKAFRKRKEEIIKEDSWDSVKKEIVSNIWFYILESLSVSSLLYSLVFITFSYYEMPDLIMPLIWLIGAVANISILLFTPELIKKALKNGTEMVSWEGYAASFCLGLFWFAVIGTITFSELFSPFLFIGIPAFLFGTGFSISSLIHRGKLNKILGAVNLAAFLFPTLPLLLGFILGG